MKDRGSIAILGGMGPEASAKMLEVMVSMAAVEFGARNNTDFPDIVLFSVPVPDFISDKKKISRAREMLIEKIDVLNGMDVLSIAIACNTAHIIANDLEKVSRAPFISMIQAVVDEVVSSKVKTVGLLATPSTISSGLYQNALAKVGINIVIPGEAQILDVERTVRNIISGSICKKDSNDLLAISNSLVRRGAQGVILGCTELPLIFPGDLSVPVFDSIEITSRALLRNYFKLSRKRGV